MRQIKYDYFVQWPENVKALERDKYKCGVCGSSESLIVHHKDNSRKLGIPKINRSLDNLITLCRPCHAKIHGQNLRFTKPTLDIILELKNQTEKFMSYTDIGKYLGISRQRVHQILKKAKLT